MNAVQPSAGFAFAVGEEVVARLDRAEIFDMTRGIELPAVRRFRWTIGSVMDCIVMGDGRGYVLWSKCRSGTYICLVPEECIEGVA